MNWPETIRKCFDSSKVFYSGHARREMLEEELGLISDHEVYEAICAGEVVKTYPDDMPYPSVLIFGMTSAGRPLHAVCAYDADGDCAIVITVYQPDPELWESFRRRIR